MKEMRSEENCSVQGWKGPFALSRNPPVTDHSPALCPVFNDSSNQGFYLLYQGMTLQLQESPGEEILELFAPVN